MNVHAYKLRLEPSLYFPTVLSPKALAGRLADDAVVSEFAPHPAGEHVVTVALQRDRDSHEEALNELLLAAQELGYSFAEAEITKVADRALEMAFGFGVTGLGAGSTTENAEVALLAAGIGWIVGLFVGATMRKAEVLFRAQWTSAGWRLIRVTPAPSVVRPALGAA